MDFSENQKALKHADHEIKVSGRIDIDDSKPLYFLNQHLQNSFGISLIDIAKDRTTALKGIGNLPVWNYNSKTISKRMHDWAVKAGFNWGEISSHSNRGGKNSLLLCKTLNYICRLLCFICNGC